jgi:protein phosphatase
VPEHLLLPISPNNRSIIDEDLFLICSDGLSDMLTDDQIEEVLHQEPTAINLIEAAKAAGGRDNVSVVLLRVTE